MTSKYFYYKDEEYSSNTYVDTWTKIEIQFSFWYFDSFEWLKSNFEQRHFETKRILFKINENKNLKQSQQEIQKEFT